MGTRATIRINGKLMYATHWDGYPDSLGADLAKLRATGALNARGVAIVAAKHSINSADRSVLRMANKMMDKAHKGKPEYGQGNFVDDIADYGDFSEFEYDINTQRQTIKVTELSGEYDHRKKGKSWMI